MQDPLKFDWNLEDYLDAPVWVAEGGGCQQAVECYHIQRILRPFY